MPEWLDTLLRHLLAVPAGLLPLRWRQALEEWLPLAWGALPSALLTFLAGFAVGVPGFLRYAARAGSDTAAAMLTTATAVNTGRAPLEAMPGAHAVSMFSLPAFVFFTPLGWLSTYLVITGLYRSIGCAVGETLSDPLLGWIDTAATTMFRRRQETRDALWRVAQEGPEVPDVLLTGREGGAPEAAYVLVSSRCKEGWTEGAFLVTSEAWFRLGAPFDQRHPGGLRRMYPLIVPGDVEVARRQVRHELPPLSEARPSRP